ncbi:MAG: hypothetical protein AAB453_02540 [Patescibacteria group bacterium]
MELRFTHSFRKDYRGLSTELQKLTDKKLILFLENYHHPSLRIKKMGGFDYIWEARINRNYRFTFQIDDDTYLIRRVGPHDILKTP